MVIFTVYFLFISGVFFDTAEAVMIRIHRNVIKVVFVDTNL